MTDTKHCCTIDAFLRRPSAEQIDHVASLVAVMRPEDRAALLVRIKDANAAESEFVPVTEDRYADALQEWEHLADRFAQTRAPGRSRLRTEDVIDAVLNALADGRAAVDIGRLREAHHLTHPHDRPVVTGVVTRLRQKIAVHYQETPGRATRVQISADGRLWISRRTA